MTTSKNPNHADKSRGDAKSAAGECSMMKAKVQLLPLRYGLVERLDPSAHLPMPFKLKSHPLGIRLLRDGYLYIIDSATGYIHEYRVEKGQITKLLWNDKEVAADERITPVGDPHLVFSRSSTLYASFSEIQWTSYKCSQVLKHPKERERLMQRIDLINACPETGGTHLLTKKQAENWLAEVAENALVTTDPHPTPLPEGANPEERQPYCWESSPLFHDTAIGALTSKVIGPYKDDFLFLVLRDDFGVMRDLSAAQLKIADWIGQWSDDEKLQRDYVTGAYIQSLYDVNAGRLGKLAETDPEVKALKDDTTSAQQDTIVEYLRVKRDYRGPAIYGSESTWREQAKHNPYAKAWIDMYDALGEKLWVRHRATINRLHLESWYALNGENLGERGIDQLVKRNPMEDFMTRQQALLRHWRALLARVREDRLQMIIGGYFSRAAWYYDFHLSSQIKHRLETEFVCIAAICGDRQSAEKLAAYLDKHLLTVVPGLDTLFLKDQVEVLNKLTELASFGVGVAEIQEAFADSKAMANQFNSLMSQRLPNFGKLNTTFRGLQNLLDEAYNPATQLRIADGLDKAMAAFERRRNIDPNSFIRNTGDHTRLRALRDFSRTGLSVRAASAAEIQMYNQTQDKALALRNTLKALYRERRLELKRQSQGLAPQGSEAAINNRILAAKNALEPLEENLLRAYTAGSGGPAQFGLVLEGMDPQLTEEFQRTVRDFRAKGTYAEPIKGALKSKADLLALGLFVFQAQKFVEALSELSKKDSLDNWLEFGKTLTTALSAGLAATQGLSVTIFKAHIEQMESAAGKLNSMARLGRWAGISGFGAYAFGAVAAGFDLYDHAKQWGEALGKGEGKLLLASSMQMTGDTLLIGTNTWATYRSGSVIRAVMRTAPEARALAWAEASPRLLSIGARANLVGLIATALQLGGEGLYNYWNLSDVQKWLRASAWGTEDGQRSLQDDWSALAVAVQKLKCELQRDANGARLRITLPGIRTAELDTRRLQLLAYQRISAAPTKGSWMPGTPVWQEASAAWAGLAQVASKGDEALVLLLDITSHQQNNDFALALTIGYQLEAERDLIHRTCFVVDDLHIHHGRDGRVLRSGTFDVKASDKPPTQLSAGQPWLMLSEQLETVHA